MKDWFVRNRCGLVSLLLVVSAWMVIISFVPTKILDILAYYALGWFFLGGVVVPWVEARLEKLFK